MKKKILIILTLILLAFIAGYQTQKILNSIDTLTTKENDNIQTIIQAFKTNNKTECPIPTTNQTNEKPSPKDRISQDQIKIYKDKVVLDIQNVLWAKIADTNSMDPIIDSNAHVLQIKPKSEQELQIGDIITYYHIKSGHNVIHRIIEISQDENGWYALTKGDNNKLPDSEKVRFAQIKKVLIGIIY